MAEGSKVVTSDDDARRQAAILAGVHALRRAVTGFQRRLAEPVAPGLSMADAHVLQFVTHAGSATPRQLADYTGLTSGSVTSLVDRLEDGGWVERRADGDDRRVVVIRLRPGVRTKVMRLMLQAHKALDALFEGWSTRRIETLADLLDDVQLEADDGAREA